MPRLQVRHRTTFMPGDTPAGEAFAIGSAVKVAWGQYVKASLGESCEIAWQAAEVLSSETRDVYSANYNGTRNPYHVRKVNVGDPVAVIGPPAIFDGFEAYFGTVSAQDALYCVGSGLLGNETSLEAAGGSTATARRVAIAHTGGTSGTDAIRIQTVAG